MKMLSISSMIFLLALMGCCSVPEPVNYYLQPDPGSPEFINNQSVRSLQVDIANAKIFLARWKIKSANDRLLVGELTEEERDGIVAPILAALEGLGIKENQYLSE